MDRDEGLLADVFGNQAMRRDQIQVLHLRAAVQSVNLRLRKLYDHGYLLRTFPGDAPYGVQAVYSIGARAVPIVAARLGLEEARVRAITRRAPTPTFLAHTLAIVDFYVGLKIEAKSSGLELVAWDPEMFCLHEYEIRPKGGGSWRKEVFRPDGHFRLRDRGIVRDGFLEMDLGHTSRRQILDKFAGYATFVDAGLFRDRYSGGSPLVAVQTTGERRLANLVEIATRFPDHDIRITTLDDILDHGPLASIWRCADGRRMGLIP
jgi:hypothetical protein